MDESREGNLGVSPLGEWIFAEEAIVDVIYSVGSSVIEGSRKYEGSALGDLIVLEFATEVGYFLGLLDGCAERKLDGYSVGFCRVFVGMLALDTYEMAVLAVLAHDYSLSLVVG